MPLFQFLLFSIRRTFDSFRNSTLHSLVMALISIGKILFTGHYTNFESFVSWQHKISWVRAPVVHIHWICTPNKTKTEIKLIGKFLSWNGFPKHITLLETHRIGLQIIVLHVAKPPRTTRIQLFGLPSHLSVTQQYSLLRNESVSFRDVLSTWCRHLNKTEDHKIMFVYKH